MMMMTVMMVMITMMMMIMVVVVVIAFCPVSTCRQCLLDIIMIIIMITAMIMRVKCFEGGVSIFSTLLFLFLIISIVLVMLINDHILDNDDCDDHDVDQWSRS